MTGVQTCALPISPQAAGSAPVPNKGDVAWMIVATAFVIMMSVPGLALFYGGLVRSKNMLSVLMQVFVTFSMIVILWCIYGYSLAFTEGNAFVGGFDRIFMRGLLDGQGRVRERGHVQQRRGDSGIAVPRLPGHLCGDHLLPDRRRLRRAHEVLRRAALHGAVVHVQLRADGAHGVVLDRPGCVHDRRRRRHRNRQGRPHLAMGARSTLRAERWCTSTLRLPAWWAR